MTNLEIIKALRACEKGAKCKDCPYFTESAICVSDLMADALNLITEQKAELEELKSFCGSKDSIINDQEVKIKALKMDNQQLETDNFNANMNSEHLQEQLDAIINSQKKQTNIITKKEALERIYELVKEFYGDCVSVDIFVNSEGIECNATEKPFVMNNSMRTIKGEWLKQIRSDENA